MLAKFTPSACRVLVRAGTLATEAHRPALGTGFLLAALAEHAPFAGADATAIRAEIGPAPQDRELLATLGVDLDDVRRRTPDVRLDDPALWRLGVDLPEVWTSLRSRAA